MRHIWPQFSVNLLQWISYFAYSCVPFSTWRQRYSWQEGERWIWLNKRRTSECSPLQIKFFCDHLSKPRDHFSKTPNQIKSLQMERPVSDRDHFLRWLFAIFLLFLTSCRRPLDTESSISLQGVDWQMCRFTYWPYHYSRRKSHSRSNRKWFPK